MVSVACVRVMGMILVLSSDEEAITVRRSAEPGAAIVWYDGENGEARCT